MCWGCEVADTWYLYFLPTPEYRAQIPTLIGCHLILASTLLDLRSFLASKYSIHSTPACTRTRAQDDGKTRIKIIPSRHRFPFIAIANKVKTHLFDIPCMDLSNRGRRPHRHWLCPVCTLMTGGSGHHLATHFGWQIPSSSILPNLLDAYLRKLVEFAILPSDRHNLADCLTRLSVPDRSKTTTYLGYLFTSRPMV